MDTLTLRRLSGLAAVAAGPLCILGGLLHPIVDGHAHDAEALVQPHLPGSLALLAGTVLLLLGLPGVYGWIAPRLGTLGLVGFVLYFVGNLLNAIPHLVLMGFAAKDIAEQHPEMISDHDVIIASPGFEAEQTITGFAFLIGLLIFGIALLRAKGLPRWLGAFAIASPLLMFVPLPVTPFLTGLQIELLRGVLLVGLGLLAIRSTRPAAA
jgi:hypothetical protein